MSRTCLFLSSFLLIAHILLMIPSDSLAADKFVIRAGHTNPADHIAGVELRKFKKIVEEKTNGRIEIKIYDNSSLGKGKELLEGVQLDTIEMALLISQPPALDPKLAIIELPWLFNDFSHEKKVLKGPVGQGIKDLIEKKNIKVLSLWFNGFRQVGNTIRAIHTPEDMHGLKIRVGSNPIRTEMFKILGANPTPVPFKEVYVALKQGVLDGAESAIDSFATMRFYEVCNHLAILNFNATPSFLLVSGDFWKKLPDDLKTILSTSAEEMMDWTYDVIGPQFHEDRINELKKTMQISYPDIPKFKKLAAPLYDDFRKQYGSEWLDLIDEAAQK